MDIDRKIAAVKEHLDAMGPQKIGEKLYVDDTIIRAFHYYSTSRSCYEKLRNDYKLPSIRTLRNLTSKISKLSDSLLIGNIFSTLSGEQKLCSILVDEVYVKPSLQYQGGHMFGRAENNLDMLVNTALAIMIKCLHRSPKFFVKMITVAKTTSQFLYDEVTKIIDIINSSNGQVVTVITDNNRTNQAFFKLFETVENKPWLTESNIFLLFDYVHLMKSIRNNWITETTRELEGEFKGDKFVAKWSHLIELFNLEKDHLVKLSSLTETSVFPKPIERQRLSSCLKIFSEKTNAALRTISRIDENDAEGTVKFLSIVLSLWKILSNKEI